MSGEVISQTGLHPSIGMAGSKFVASIAAEPASPDRPLLIDRKREREFLSPLPVDLLPLSEETRRRLELLGLHTIGQIASLPYEEYTFDTADVLMAAIGELVDRLIARLRNRNQVCSQVSLQFHLDDGKCWQETLNLKTPTDSRKEMLTILKDRMERVHFPTGITGIKLTLLQLGPEQGDQRAP